MKQIIQSALDASNHEVKELFFSSEVSQDDLYEDYFENEDTAEFFNTLREANVSITCVDNHGGEGEGDAFWSVYSFSNKTEIIYVQFDGSYASYYGSDYHDWFFVEPKQVTVTRFSRIK